MELMSLLAGILVGTQASLPLLPTPPIDISDRVGLGSCIGRDGPIELRRVLFLENRVVDFQNDRIPMRITLLGQTVRVETLRQPSDSISVLDIGEAVSDGSAGADVNLKLALMDERLVVYWRETFQHRIVQQGLFLVNGQHLSALCRGRAGSEVSH